MRAVEQALGLPSGAWQRRRLFALKTRSRAFEEIGIQKGDALIVEPGERLRPAQLVVVKEAGRISVRLCGSLGGKGRVPLGQADLLPFMKVRTHVVGTVVGTLRRDERGQLYTVARRVPRPRIPRNLAPRVYERARLEAERIAQAQGFERRLRSWELWTEHHRAELDAVSESLAGCCKDFQKRLATLLECMRQARGDRLFCALRNEARTVCEDMERVRRYVRRNALPTDPRAASSFGDLATRSAQ